MIVPKAQQHIQLFKSQGVLAFRRAAKLKNLSIRNNLFNEFNFNSA